MNNALMPFYRKSEIKVLQGVELTYYYPNAAQILAFTELIINAMSAAILSDAQRKKLSKNQLFEKCIQEFAVFGKGGGGQEGELKVISLITQITSGPESAPIFDSLILACFPIFTKEDLPFISDEVKGDIFIILLEELNKNLGRFQQHFTK